MITAADFEGKWAITKAFGVDKLQPYIDANTPQILAELFGVEMYEEWVNDDTLFPELFEKFVYQLKCGQVISSTGIKTMLLNYVYAIYTRDAHITATSGGNVVLKPEGGQAQTDNMATFIRFYNDAISTFRAIQARIKDNAEDYPLFKGQDKETTWFC
jgi:hypothetical protein